MAIINFTDKTTGQASTFETGSGKFLRLEDSQGAVHLFAASEITLSGTNGTVTAGQTLDLSTLLTVPPVLAGRTVSWSKVSGSTALTLSGHTVTAASGATDSDSADFVATVAGISATVTVTATAAAPATYDITIPTVTGATITVLVNDAAYTYGKLTHGDSVRITVAAQPNYNLTSSSVTMGGQPVTGSNGEYNISSVTGAVVISTTVELEPDEPSGGETLKFTATKNGSRTGGILIELVPEAYTTVDYRFSNHNPKVSNDWYNHKTTTKDSNSFTVSGVSGTLGEGFPASVEIKKKTTGTAIAFTRTDVSKSEDWLATLDYTGQKFDAVFCSGSNIFDANTAYEVTLTWA